MIEVEIRSFISKDKYLEFLEFFKKNGELLNQDEQETHYFDSEEDLRIQKNNFFSKIWLKKGKIHEEQREEIEVKFDKEQFEEIGKLFSTLGYGVEIKWFRKRHTFRWEDIDVMVDHTQGYGYILELEKLSSEDEKEKTLELLKQKMKILNIPITPKEEFDKKYLDYKENWKNLIQNENIDQSKDREKTFS